MVLGCMLYMICASALLDVVDVHRPQCHLRSVKFARARTQSYLGRTYYGGPGVGTSMARHFAIALDTVFFCSSNFNLGTSRDRAAIHAVKLLSLTITARTAGISNVLDSLEGYSTTYARSFDLVGLRLLAEPVCCDYYVVASLFRMVQQYIQQGNLKAAEPFSRQ